MKEINGFPGYFVTPEGKVFSTRQGNLKELKQSPDKRGYPMVALNNRANNIKYRTFRIHRLVAEAYIPNPDNLPQVNHINEDKWDNRVENLEWLSNADNIRYSQDKLYVLENKNGERFDVIGLESYCRNNNMIRYNLWQTYEGVRRKWHHDHRIVSVRELSPEERQQRLRGAMISATTGGGAG